jgi:hypothetical protein
MSLIVRMEKLLFIVNELELSLTLVNHAGDDFSKRTIARHILIRAKDFIEHSRQLKNTLLKAGYKSQDLEKEIKAYASNFEEYFAASRNKMGAHVQDLDFGKRIELWNDIELVKLKYFSESALEIYKGTLSSMGFPEYTQYSSFAELSDSKFISVLENWQDKMLKGEKPQLANDPLALTRQNTVGLINLTEIHQRAGQLSLMHRWIVFELAFFNELKNYSGSGRILKSLILTDTISFADCLITRPVAAGALQEMDGLDAILTKEKEDISAISEFLQVYKFNEALTPLRNTRNLIAAHVDTEIKNNINDLTYLIDSLQISDIFSFYGRLKSLFDKICRGKLYLSHYLADGSQIHGIIMTEPSDLVVPFDDKEPTDPPDFPQIPDWNDEELYSQYLDLWITSNGDNDESRYYFRNAFLNSDVVENIQEEINNGPHCTRYNLVKYRKAHLFIESTLINEKDNKRISLVLELLAACSTSDPNSIAYIIYKYTNVCPDTVNCPICRALGKLASWSHPCVDKFLKPLANDTTNNDRVSAILSLFEIYIRTEGLNRANSKAKGLKFGDSIQPFIDNSNPADRLGLLMVLASHLCVRPLNSYYRYFENDYKLWQKEIESCAKSYFAAGKDSEVLALIQKLINSHDYPGLTLLLHDKFENTMNDNVGKYLLLMVTNNFIVPRIDHCSLCNTACCFLRNKKYKEALNIASYLAINNPDSLSLQVFYVQILCELPNARDNTLKAIAKIRHDYKIDQGSEDILASIETHLKL